MKEKILKLTIIINSIILNPSRLIFYHPTTHTSADSKMAFKTLIVKICTDIWPVAWSKRLKSDKTPSD